MPSPRGSELKIDQSDQNRDPYWPVAIHQRSDTMKLAPNEPAKSYYSIPDLVERWGVSRRTIYREIERGRLKRKHIGGQIRFSFVDVSAYERQAGGTSQQVTGKVLDSLGVSRGCFVAWVTPLENRWLLKKLLK